MVDGSTGLVLVDPGDEVLGRYRDEIARRAERRARDMADAARAAVTVDGAPIDVTANLGSVADARTAAAAGADGAGLVRTEFLFLDRDDAPDVAETGSGSTPRWPRRSAAGRSRSGRWTSAGTSRCATSARRRRTTRSSACAASGCPWRARNCFVAQLDAICRVARSAPVKVMFPMVTTVDELVAARRLLVDAAGPQGVPRGLRVGMMVEVPAAALNIDAFLPHVDFVSIGTNDLTQYTLAVERGNPAVASLADPLDPAVLRLVGEVARRAAGRATVSVCGEVAADEAAIPVLLGLGVGELSVSAAAVPAVKAAVRTLDLGLCAALAERCLRAGSAAEVRGLVATSARRAAATGGAGRPGRGRELSSLSRVGRATAGRPRRVRRSRARRRRAGG